MTCDELVEALFDFVAEELAAELRADCDAHLGRCPSCGADYVPLHLSKDQDIPVLPGDRITISTPGGGGFGPPFERLPESVTRELDEAFFGGAA